MSSCSYLHVLYLLEVLLLKDAHTCSDMQDRRNDVGVDQHQKLLATALALWAFYLASSREG